MFGIEESEAGADEGQPAMHAKSLHQMKKLSDLGSQRAIAAKREAATNRWKAASSATASYQPEKAKTEVAPSAPAHAEVFVPVPCSISSWMRKHGKLAKPVLTQKQRMELRECFDLIDADGSGSLSVDEIQSAFKHMGVKLVPSLLQKVIADLDQDGSGQIEYQEFVKLMTGTLEAAMLAEQAGLTGTPTVPPVPLPLLCTAYRRRRLLEAMVSDNVELRMKMLEIQRRSEAEMEREQKDRARKTLLKRRAQLLMKLSGLKPKRPNQDPVTPPRPRTAPASTLSPNPPARGGAPHTCTSPRNSKQVITVVPVTEFYGGGGGWPATRKPRSAQTARAGGGVYTKALERACVSHVREQDMQSALQRQQRRSTATLAGQHRSEPVHRSPRAGAALTQSRGEVLHLLSQLSPRMHPPTPQSPGSAASSAAPSPRTRSLRNHSRAMHASGASTDRSMLTSSQSART